MFDTRFNNGYQSAAMPLNQDPYAAQYAAQYPNQLPQSPYMQGNMLSNMMSNNSTYPAQYSTPPNIQNQNPNTVNYADGGEVKRSKNSKKNKQNSPYPALAEMIRQQGKGEDTVLAHINPLEAMLLHNIGGSGTINPKTGLPQFGIIKSPNKWFKSVIGPAVGTVLGNILLPGVGGMVGGALGGALGSKARGRKDVGQAAFRGLGIGAAAPTIAGLAGSGLSSLGAEGLGGTLSQYGNDNAILPSLSKLLGIGGEGAKASGYMGGNSISPNALQNAIAPQYSIGEVAKDIPKQEMSFMDKLMGKSKDFLTDPKNLLTAASVGSSFLNRPKAPKEKSPEQLADEQKRLQKALRLTPAEMKDMEANMLAEEQAKRRVARQKFLPEERLGHIEPLYRKSHTPEEYKKHGKWFNYYNNPEFSGEPIPFKRGGMLEGMLMGEMHPESGYIGGIGGGQDDDIRMDLPENSYIIDASTVSDIGDGNSKAGAEKIKALVSSGEYKITPDKLDLLVKNVRKHKRGGKVNLPPKAKPLTSYMR